MPERARRHARDLRELADEVLGALVAADLRDLGDGAGGVFQSVFREFNARVDHIINRADAEGLFVESLEAGAAEIQTAKHSINVPVELGVEHHVASEGEQLVVIWFVQNINVAVGELCEQNVEEAQHFRVVDELKSHSCLNLSLLVCDILIKPAISTIGELSVHLMK